MPAKSISRKLLLFILATTFSVLFLSCGVLITYEVGAYKRSAAANLSTLAKIIAANSTATLIFDDEKVAREILSGLKAEPDILSACLFDKNGVVYATYPLGTPASAMPKLEKPSGLEMANDEITIFEPVVQGNERIGTLFVRQSLRGLYNRASVYTWVVISVLAGSCVIAFVLANVFQKRISRPILDLAGKARIVSEKKDYSIRASRISDDELGSLTEAFNEMLEQIQQRDHALQSAQDKLKEYATQLEQKVAERTHSLQETTDQLNAFVYTIAHDLKAPIRAQIAFSKMLLDEFGAVLGPEGSDYATRLMQAAARQAQMVEDLLAHVRLSREELPLQKLNLSQVIQEVQTDLALEAERLDAQIIVGPLEGQAVVHPASFRLVVQNLVGNALKFVTPGVKPMIRIWTEKKGQFLRLWVQDNGIGIEPSQVQKLFGLFQRLHTREKYPGTGIGLALVKKAMERMGGDVGVESEPGKGSRFWVDLQSADHFGAMGA